VVAIGLHFGSQSQLSRPSGRFTAVFFEGVNETIGGSHKNLFFGVTILSGSVAVALKQASETGVASDFLSLLAATVLLGVAGAMCVLILVMLVVAKPRGLEVEPTLDPREKTF